MRGRVVISRLRLARCSDDSTRARPARCNRGRFGGGGKLAGKYKTRRRHLRAYQSNESAAYIMEERHSSHNSRKPKRSGVARKRTASAVR